MKSIFIFRRDFRITDNTGLIECIKNSDTVYPIFIFTPEQIKNNDFKSDNAVQFMITSLKYLAKKIDITFCYGDYIKVLKEMVKKYKIDSIYTNTDYTKYAIKREKDILKLAKELEIEFKYFDDICLFKIVQNSDLVLSIKEIQVSCFFSGFFSSAYARACSKGDFPVCFLTP